MNKPTVWIYPGLIAIYGSSIDTSPHSHLSMQLIWPLEHSFCQLNGKDIFGPTLIDSQVSHQLEISEGWILLIEPKSSLGQVLTSKLEIQKFSTVKNTFPLLQNKPTQNKDVFQYITPLFQSLDLDAEQITSNVCTVKDARIQSLLTELDQCLQGDCIKPSNWRASEVASQLALSESRFLHLFKEELGIPWRPYILWRRMMCAIQALINNKSATDAAHVAGFSDSAHLSRTFRNNFGMTIRQALTIFKS